MFVINFGQDYLYLQGEVYRFSQGVLDVLKDLQPLGAPDSGAEIYLWAGERVRLSLCLLDWEVCVEVDGSCRHQSSCDRQVAKEFSQMCKYWLNIKSRLEQAGITPWASTYDADGEQERRRKLRQKLLL
jgi:hypothetical protein